MKPLKNGKWILKRGKENMSKDRLKGFLRQSVRHFYLTNQITLSGGHRLKKSSDQLQCLKFLR
jgi:hypothetical protein